MDQKIEIALLVLGVILRLIATKDYMHVLKRAVDEAGVKNGLEKLRQKLLLSAVIMILINTTGLIFIVVRPFTEAVLFSYISSILIAVNSFGFYIDARIKRQIYGEQYTPKQKSIHRKVEKIEKQQDALKS